MKIKCEHELKKAHRTAASHQPTSKQKNKTHRESGKIMERGDTITTLLKFDSTYI